MTDTDQDKTGQKQDTCTRSPLGNEHTEITSQTEPNADLHYQKVRAVRRCKKS